MEKKKEQIVTFHCHKCGQAVECNVLKLECEHCGHHLVWSHARVIIENDKFKRYEILI